MASTHANVFKHLRLLREAGLVARRKGGVQVYYRLDDPVVRKLCELACESLLDGFEADGGEGTPCWLRPVPSPGRPRHSRPAATGASAFTACHGPTNGI